MVNRLLLKNKPQDGEGLGGRGGSGLKGINRGKKGHTQYFQQRLQKE